MEFKWEEVMVKPGMEVKVNNLGSSRGMIINPEFIAQRKNDATGKLLGYVPGHGGDVWFVEHADGTQAPYAYTEMTVTGPPELLKKGRIEKLNSNRRWHEESLAKIDAEIAKLGREK